MADILLLLGAFICGIAAALISYRMTTGGAKRVAQKIIQQASRAAEARSTEEALRLKSHEVEQQQLLAKLLHGARAKIAEEEERLKQREDRMEERISLVQKKLSHIDKKEAILSLRKQRIEKEKLRIFAARKQVEKELEALGGLTSLEAKTLLLKRLEADVQSDAAKYLRRSAAEVEEHAEASARKIIALAIQRVSSSTASDFTTTCVNLPSDELKGRIIGKEGRNIKALEMATGVNFLVDDTPGAVVISGFDPVRKQIAKQALTELLHDGRIHPTRIEEAVAKAKIDMARQITKWGEDAAHAASQVGLHPELIQLLGRLKLRYSLGQNVLDHSLEVSHLMGMIAAELGLNGPMARRIGLLHDIGKAVSHEVEGTHALIGRDLALRYGESELVANGIGCHHGEIEPTSIEASLCSAADALSGARPGARVEAIEHYLKRLGLLENLASEVEGVEKAWAMQAGREVRVVVKPEAINDDQLLTVARDVAKRIEQGLAYPGKIKVTVIREKRAVEWAL